MRITITRDALPQPALARRTALFAPDPHAEAEAERAADRVLGAARSELTGPAALPSSLTHGSPAPLPPAAQRFFEARFGHDFSHVRLHADVEAGGAADRLRARAFTSGHHIRFGREQYRPHDPDGQRLLAHELAHVVQQSPSRRSGTLAAGLSHAPAGRIQPKLIATGDAAGFAAFANSVLAVQVEVVVSAAGEVSVRQTNVQGPPTPEAQELRRVIELVAADRRITTIEFIHGATSTRATDRFVLGGNYQLSRVDLDDLANLGTQESVGLGQGRTGGAVLAHEIMEQYRKQIHGEAYPAAHAHGTTSEGAAIGATRGPERFRQVNATTLEVTIPYTYPNGRVVEVTWDIVNGNYVNVRRRVVTAGTP